MLEIGRTRRLSCLETTAWKPRQKEEYQVKGLDFVPWLSLSLSLSLSPSTELLPRETALLSW